MLTPSRRNRVTHQAMEPTPSLRSGWSLSLMIPLRDSKDSSRVLELSTPGRWLGPTASRLMLSRCRSHILLLMIAQATPVLLSTSLLTIRQTTEKNGDALISVITFVVVGMGSSVQRRRAALVREEIGPVISGQRKIIVSVVHEV